MKKICLAILIFTAFCFGQDAEGLKNACEKENFANCFELGNIYMHKERNFIAAEEYYHKACKGGVDEGCSMLEAMYSFGYRVSGLHPHEEKYYSVLNKFHEKRCGQNIADSCYAIAITYHNGDRGYQKDGQKAAKYAKKACDIGGKEYCKVYEDMLTFAD